MDYWKYIGAGAVTLAATSATALYYWSDSGVLPMKPCIDLKKQSIVLPGPERIHISTLCKDGKLMEYIYHDVHTLYEAFMRGKRVSNNGQFLGWRSSPTAPYEWIHYQEAEDRARNFGSGLIKLGQSPDNATHIGIYSQNRPEYLLTEQACYMRSMAIVPLYDTLGPDACSFIISQAEVSLVVCDKRERAEKLLNGIEKHPNLKTIVMIEDIEPDFDEKASSVSVRLMSYQSVEEIGKANPHELNLCKPDDVCAIPYTSGTTGQPKGVILTHKGIMSTVSACVPVIEGINIKQDDAIISYLPLAHGYERLCEVYCYMHGVKIGFFQGDVKKLMDDIKELQPAFFPSVPRLLNRLYDKVMNSVNSSIIKRTLFNLCLREKKKLIERGIFCTNSIWDKLAFKNIQAALGGKMKFIPSGSAPISDEVLQFIRLTSNAYVIEGYGQTESSAICTLQVPGDLNCGQVGPPLPCNMIKLVDVPEMDYYAFNEVGEVCVKGPNVFKGYLKNDEKTKEALDDDGWLHTGDIGRWMPNGSLKIIDRIKNLFKLAQGEYIAPEKIENIYGHSKLIAQIYVHGDSFMHFLVGIVVPDPEILPSWAEENLSLKLSMDELIKRKEVKEAILSDLNAVAKSSGLNTFEQVKDIYLTNELFTVDNNLLTPTFKSKRRELSVLYAKQLLDMYTASKIQ